MRSIVLGGGCFWGMEELFRARPGVIDTTVGYAGGHNNNPTYEFHPGHAEALKVEYDESQTTLRSILDFFFTIHDPTTIDQQGNDIGSSYRSVVFYVSPAEKQEAEAMIEVVDESKRWPGPVVTTLEPLDVFYPAEKYHQDYLQKNPGGYTCHYQRFSSYDT